VSRRVVLIALAVVALAAVFGYAMYAAAGSGDDLTLAPDVEAQAREAIVAYTVEQQPVVPAEFYGEPLTMGPCIKLLKTHSERLAEVASSSVITPSDTGWSYLALIRGQIRELQGALPVGWSGDIVYWDVVDAGDDTCTVRAAVQMTLTSAYWDEETQRLGDTTSFTYSSTSADQYALERIDGAWMITGVDRWMYYDVPGGPNTAP
jgi:hypothetical protein